MDNDKNPRARVRDLMGDGYSYTSNTLRSRARACEDFYGAAIAREVDAAVDEPRGASRGPRKRSSRGIGLAADWSPRERQRTRASSASVAHAASTPAGSPAAAATRKRLRR